MTLAAVQHGIVRSPRRTLAYGVEGVGKTTFAADAEGTIFLAAEQGFGELDVARFPQAREFEDILEAIRTLRTEPHGFKTLAVDTVDWVEPLIWKFCCDRDRMKDIEAYGYGKGYTTALDQWRLFLNELELTQAKSGMQVVLLAHSWIKTFKNPSGDDYDRHELKVNNKAAGLLKEWADVVLFMNFQTVADTDAKTKRVRGLSTGARFCYTKREAIYDAKTRFTLPDRFPLSWAEYEAHLSGTEPGIDTDALREEIVRKSIELGGNIQTWVDAQLSAGIVHVGSLVKINDRLDARLAALPAVATE